MAAGKVAFSRKGDIWVRQNKRVVLPLYELVAGVTKANDQSHFVLFPVGLLDLENGAAVNFTSVVLYIDLHAHVRLTGLHHNRISARATEKSAGTGGDS